MPKISVTGTMYLVTVDMGDYYNFPTPFRLYASRAKADRLIERIKRHHAAKPSEPQDGDDTHEWWLRLDAWQLKHPGGRELSYKGPDAWQVQPMRVC